MVAGQAQGAWQALHEFLAGSRVRR